MTLAKTSARRPSSHQRKRSAQHHKQGSHYMKPYWPYIPIVAILLFGLFFNSFLSGRHQGVLSYATEMSMSGLLDGTNAQRNANGLPSLGLNGLLNQAAQAKAQDMMNNDYWAHVSPSGTTPWYFITNAGYSYQTAGENLAYGFTTSGDTITGWMNSAGHRANILNSSYQEVGFGVVNAPNYQSSGPQTIVVAMYAQPYAAAAPAPTPAATPAPAPVAVSKPAAATAPVVTEEAAVPVAETPVEPVESTASDDNVAATPENTSKTPNDSTATITSPVPSQDISRIEVLTAANVSWGQFALSMIASLALLVFLLRHSFAWHKVLIKGERFVIRHPLLDIAFVAIATAGFILTQTTGIIK